MTALQHTLGHLNCPACEGAKRAMMYGSALGELLFPEAAAIWAQGRKNLAASSRKHNSDYIVSLSKFFGQMRLKDIHIGNVAQYQEFRQQAIRQSRRHRATSSGEENPTDGASRINHEISCLGQIMRQAGLWEPIKAFYEPLKLPESEGMALTREEEDHLFQVARSRPRWLVAYYCSQISRYTTAGPGEIRHLRLKDIDLQNEQGPVIHIQEGVKNEFRKRPLPLNEKAAKAVAWLLQRACKLGATDPEHYLLPHRAHKRGAVADPGRPMNSWKKAHAALRCEAAKKYSRLARFRQYDFRHTACTVMLEDPTIAYTTIEHMMGHRIDSKTKRKYDHLRNKALRAAAESLSRIETPKPAAVSMPSWSLPPRRRPRGVRWLQTSAQRVRR